MDIPVEEKKQFNWTSMKKMKKNPPVISPWITGRCSSQVKLCNCMWVRKSDVFSYLWAPSSIGRQKVSVATLSGSTIQQSETGLAPLSWAKKDSSSSLTHSTTHISACAAKARTAADCLTPDRSTETPKLCRFAMTPSSDLSAHVLNCTKLPSFPCSPDLNSSTSPALSNFGWRCPVKTTALTGLWSVWGEGVAKSLWMTCPSIKREQLIGKPDTDVCNAGKLSFTNWSDKEGWSFLNFQWVRSSQARSLIKSRWVQPRRVWKNDANSFWTQWLFVSAGNCGFAVKSSHERQHPYGTTPVAMRSSSSSNTNASNSSAKRLAVAVSETSLELYMWDTFGSLQAVEWIIRSIDASIRIKVLDPSPVTALCFKAHSTTILKWETHNNIKWENDTWQRVE